MKFRIKQIGENKSIPQAKKNIFDGWVGIENNLNVCHSEKFQEQYCVVDSEYEATEIITNYKQKTTQDKKYPIYIKVK